MKIVVAGAAGYIGQQLAPALEARDHAVLHGSRTPHRRPRNRPWVTLDLDRPHSLEPALVGQHTAVFLVRATTEQAHLFQQAAHDAGIRQIVALGTPDSPHLQALDEGPVPTTTLRTALIIGEGSEGWTVCRDLAVRVPFLIQPPWFENRFQPLFIGDLLAAICHAVEHPTPGAWDLPGPAALTARDLVREVAQAKNMRVGSLPFPADLQRFSALWLRGFTRVDGPTAKRIVTQLAQERLLDEPGYWGQMQHERLRFSTAARRVLRYEKKPARLPERLLESIVRRLAGAGLKRTTPKPH